MAHDPRVGMIGGSYGGQVQFAAAGIDPRVDAIVPIITWNDLSYSLAPNNTDIPDPARHGVSYDTPGSEKVGWTSLFFGVGHRRRHRVRRHRPHPRRRLPQLRRLRLPREGADGRPRLPDRGHHGLRAARRASTSYVDRIRIPTLRVQGENDTLFNLQEAVATYRALQAQGTETKMVWQSWGHSGSTPAPGELDMRHPEQSYEGQRVIAWFQRYLEDKAVDTGPELSFRDWVGYSGIATPAYGTSPSYPVGTTQRLLLSGAGDLVTSNAAVTAGSSTYANLAGEAPLSYSEVSALQGDPIPDGVTPPYDTPGSFASWTTRPLAAAVVSVGVPQLTVRVSSPVAEQPSGPVRPASCCCSRRSTTWRRTEARPWSTGSSPRPGSPT